MMCESGECALVATEMRDHGAGGVFHLCDKHAVEHEEMVAAEMALLDQEASDREEDHRVEAALDEWRGA